jgi:tRNA pseudouridine13 synthase
VRIKERPEDFRVEELVDLSLQKEGKYAIYRLKKENLDSLSLAQRVAFLLGVNPSKVVVPALKDKKAVAIQHLSIGPLKKAPPPKIKGKGFEGELLGFSPRHLSPQDLKGNLFKVIIRDLERREIELLKEALLRLKEEGFPNYFDLQRFGSWSRKKGFPGKALLKGEWEEVLRFYLVEVLLGDPERVRELKKRASSLWGDWKALKEILPSSNQRSVVDFLIHHPEDFKKAVNLINPRILSLWLSAYQSFLWNELLSRYLERLSQKEGLSNLYLELPFQRLLIPIGPFPPRVLESLKSERLPLPKRNLTLKEEWEAVFLEVLREEALEPKDLKVKGLKRVYLSSAERSVWVIPEKVKALEEEPDELYPSKWKMSLSFELPQGSYGTLFLQILANIAGLEFHTPINAGNTFVQ